MFAALGIRVQHECAAGDCWTSVLDKVVEQWKDDHFAIVFMGGGNLGDIYMAEQLLKINVMEVSLTSIVSVVGLVHRCLTSAARLSIANFEFSLP